YINQGGGRFVRDAQALPPMLTCTASVAAGDFNGDGKPDLFVGGRLTPRNYPYPTRSYLLRNDGGRFTDVTAEMAPDLAQPFGMNAADFTGNQGTDIVLTQVIDGKEYPFFGRARLGPTIYPVALRVPRYSTFAAATVDELFGAAALKRALHYQVDTFASLYLQNNGDGTFTATPLPQLAQISPIRGIVARDVDGDGKLDLIVAGSVMEMEPNTTAPDAGNGLWLKGDGQGHLIPVPP